ncbi:MAG TPA: signal peptidase I [Jatrophihabitantaceae bacterium]
MPPAERRDPADDDALADSFDIDGTADDNPAPARGAGDLPAGDAATPQAPSAAVEPGAVDMTKHSDADPDAAAPAPPDAPPATGGSRHRRRKQRPHRKAPWWEMPALIALAILIAILVKTFLVQPFYIPSESMEKTLHGCPGCSGDRILVSKIVYDFRDPHPGDIVVFNAPPGWDDEPPSVPPSNPVLRVIRGFGQLIGFVPPDGMVLVKRVIAAGGQSVKGTSNGNVYVRDAGSSTWRKLDETYVYETGTDPRAKFGPITVPKGRLWVMGDHRDRSADSRYHCGQGGTDGPDNSSCNVTAATVPISNVIGKAVVIAWPPSRWTTLGTPKTFTSDAAALGANGLVPAMVVVPVFWIVRRRRRRR